MFEDEGRSVGLSYFSSLRGFSDDARGAGYKEEFLLSTGLRSFYLSNEAYVAKIT